MLSKKLKNLSASPTLALAAQAEELKNQGYDVISLTVGEPDWPTYQKAKEAGKRAIDENKTTYTPASGIMELKEAISQQMSRQLKIEIKPSHVTVGSGAKFIIYSVLNALLDPDDEVILPAPYWVSYPSMVQLAGGVPRIISCKEDNGFKLTAKQLVESIGVKTKALILNSPNNPTGAEYTREELSELGNVIKNHPRLIILSDDIYNQLSFGEKTLSPHILQGNPDLFERCVCINGVSKAYAMTGWRIGWAVGMESLIKAVGRFQSQTTGSPCSISQWASVEAVNHCFKGVRDHLNVLKERKEFFIKELSGVEGLGVFPPRGAFYLWVNIRKWMGRKYGDEKLENSRQVAALLLEHEKLVVVPGKEFGYEAYLRLSFAADLKDLKEGAVRLTRFQSHFSD